MAILIDADTRILVQGITGRIGASFEARMLRHGTPIVAGVTPGKGGTTTPLGTPVFDTVVEAVARTGADASLIIVPPLAAKRAFMDAVRGGIRLVTIYTENVPVHDAAEMVAVARARGVRFLGPNSAGVVSPGKANLSDLNDLNLVPGRIGIISRSGTLTYEVIAGLHRYGLGESTVACLGGDPIAGTDHADLLPLFAADPDTDAVVLIGEIGGRAEIEAADTWRALACGKPLIAYIAGHAAPPGKRMGHAGAIIAGTEESAAAKDACLAAAGALVAPLVGDVPVLVATALRVNV
jgi:succinyl-CoA synthetase alpha subunit